MRRALYADNPGAGRNQAEMREVRQIETLIADAGDDDPNVGIIG